MKFFIDTAAGHTLPRIQALIPNSPALGKLKATDFIMSVNDVSCKDKTIEEVVSQIRGEVGTNVHITVADNHDGDHPRTYDIPRVSIQLAPPADPSTAFFTYCDNEVKTLRNKGVEIVKTFNSDCGNFFFNFEAEPREYHVRVMTMEVKGTGTYTPGFYPTARVFENDNEASAVDIAKVAPHDGGNFMVAQLYGDINFKKSCVGVVSINLHDDASKCHSMFVVVYK